MPYDLVLDINSRLLRIQVKAAWWDEAKENYVVDNRRTKTDRRKMVRANYEAEDFDFSGIYLQEPAVFYIMPIAVLIKATKNLGKSKAQLEAGSRTHLICRPCPSIEHCFFKELRYL